MENNKIILKFVNYMRKSNKKLIPKHIRNKHAKQFRRLLKNKRVKGINAKMICLS